MSGSIVCELSGCGREKCEKVCRFTHILSTCFGSFRVSVVTSPAAVAVRKETEAKAQRFQFCLK